MFARSVNRRVVSRQAVIINDHAHNISTVFDNTIRSPSHHKSCCVLNGGGRQTFSGVEQIEPFGALVTRQIRRDRSCRCQPTNYIKSRPISFVA